MRRNSVYERTAQSLLALLVGVVLLLGWLAYDHNGMHFAAEVRISAPSDQVWNFLVEPAKRTNWHAGVTSILPLDDHEAGAGVRSLVLYRDGGPTIEVEETIVEIMPPALWRVKQESDVFSSEIKITLTATSEGSLVAYRETKLLLSFTDKYMAPWLRWQGQRRLNIGMARLKLLAERAAAQSESDASSPTQR